MEIRDAVSIPLLHPLWALTSFIISSETFWFKVLPSRAAIDLSFLQGSSSILSTIFDFITKVMNINVYKCNGV